MASEEKGPFGKLGKLETELYSRANEVKIRKVDSLGSDDAAKAGSDVPTDWKDTLDLKKKSENFMKKGERIGFSIFKKIMFFSILFFLFAAGFAAYVFFTSGNKISTENVAINISGPVSTGAGETLSFDIIMENQNNVDLEGATLLIEYPDGTKAADNPSQDLLRQSEDLGAVAAGQVIRRHEDVVVFGQENDTRRIIVSLEYRVKDSSATYFKEQNYDITIATAPVRMAVSSLKEVVSGKNLDMTVEINSNSSTVVSGLLLRADYPVGFNFLSATPSAAFSNNVFIIGDLSPGEKRTITIQGTIDGQDNDQRNFRFTLGLPDKNDQRNVGTVYISSTQLVTIKKPFLSSVLSLDGYSTDPYAVGAGQKVQGQITWTNNLPTRITDVEIQAKIDGTPLDRFSITANQGFYRSQDNIILWNKTTSDSFSVAEPGESGTVSFSFSSLPASTLLSQSGVGNEISIELNVKAKRFSDTDGPEEILSTVSRKVRVSSDLSLNGRSLYYTGPITNQGPIPPKAEVNTTYTIVWTITNTLNNVSNAQVTAALPGYITWIGQISPPGESVTYDPLSNQVTWNVGDVRAGTGFSSTPREVAFQLSFVPSLSQRGTSPALIGPAAISAVDRYTGAVLKDSTKSLTTRIDDGFISGQQNFSNVVP